MATDKSRKKKRRKLVFFPFDLLFWIMAIVLIIYGIMNYYYPKKSISIFGIQHYVISSTSMDPVLKYGDMVFSRKINFDKLEPNDIIIFYADVNASGNKIILTHYFDSIEINENGEKIYRTRRAGTDTIDSWRIYEEDILGEYIFHFKRVGKVILFFRSPLGKRVLIIDLLILILIVMVKGYSYKKDSNETNTS
jgi:signal peptidase